VAPFELDLSVLPRTLCRRYYLWKEVTLSPHCWYITLYLYYFYLQFYIVF